MTITYKPKRQHTLPSHRSGVRCLMMAAVTDHQLIFDTAGTDPAEKELIMNDNTQAQAQAAAAAEPKLAPAVVQTDDNDAETEMQLAAGRFEHLNLTAEIRGKDNAYCSMEAADNKAKVTLYNACNQPSKLAEHINETIDVLHVYIEVITITNKVTGSLDKAPRIVLIDVNGKGYQAVSVGIYNAVVQMMHIFGEPGTWSGPHKVKVKHIPLEGGNHTMSLEILS